MQFYYFCPPTKPAARPAALLQDKAIPPSKKIPVCMHLHMFNHLPIASGFTIQGAALRAFQCGKHVLILEPGTITGTSFIHSGI
eukprot:1142239-Pelagomonas_calceolata.AAC.1